MKPIEYKGHIYKSPTALKKIAVEYAKWFCDKENISYKEIHSRDNRMDVVDRRAKVSRYLFSLGFSSLAIGYAINKDHSTVLNYKSPKFDHHGDWQCKN